MSPVILQPSLEIGHFLRLRVHLAQCITIFYFISIIILYCVLRSGATGVSNTFRSGLKSNVGRNWLMTLVPLSCRNDREIFRLCSNVSHVKVFRLCVVLRPSRLLINNFVRNVRSFMRVLNCSECSNELEVLLFRFFRFAIIEFAIRFCQLWFSIVNIKFYIWIQLITSAETEYYSICLEVGLLHFDDYKLNIRLVIISMFSTSEYIIRNSAYAIDDALIFSIDPRLIYIYHFFYNGTKLSTSTSYTLQLIQKYVTFLKWVTSHNFFIKNFSIVIKYYLERTKESVSILRFTVTMFRYH